MKNFINTLVGRPNTVKTQKSLYSNHIEPHLKTIEEEGQDAAARMVKIWMEYGLKGSTIRQLIPLLKKYVRWAHNIEISKIRTSTWEPVEEVKAWNKEELAEVLKQTKVWDEELYPMLLVTVSTGIRKGELFGLRYNDVDPFNGVIKVSRSYDGPTKSGRPRIIPMTKTVAETLLNDYTVGEEDKHCFKQCDPNPRLARICNLIGVPVLTWHGLRHTFATLALEAGRSPRDVQAVLGHAQLSTTLNLYWSRNKEPMDMEGIIP